MPRAYDKTSVIKDTNPFYIVNVILLLYSPYAEHKFKWMSHKINENPFSFFLVRVFFVIFAPRSRTREEKRGMTLFEMWKKTGVVFTYFYEGY